MNKSLISLALLGVLVLSLGGVFATGDSQTVGGTLADFVQVSVTPESLSFNSIPFNSNVNVVNSENVVINSTGSATDSGQVHVDSTVEGADMDFFSALLKFRTVEDPENWVFVHNYGTDFAAGSSVSYPIALMGDTTGFTPGPKSATIVYTISVA